ncbi:MAG TPA: alkaline phosphatase D family protein, partial [Chthoniobacteraceae bacterium]|nr:alkaline phosphatase D family protein [Chthoniobacteraceae bacterium]
MTFSRRFFLISVAGFFAWPLLESPVAAQLSVHPSDDKKLPPVPADEPIEGPVFLKCGPMLGHVAPDRAFIWVKASNAARASVKVSLHADLRESRLVPGPALGAETGFAGVVEVPDLTPDTRYYYNVLLDDEPATARPALSFVTAPAKGGGKLRVAFVSCSGYRGYMSAASWGEMAERADFDVLLQLGDNHYGNTSDLAKQRANYTMHRQVAGFRALTAKVPCYGIWDDHDFGPNNSDTTLKGKEDSLRAFKEFWANPTYGLADTPGCFFKFSRGDVDFFMLDVRYHRSPDKAEKDEHKTMLGAAQLEWLKRELKASKARVKFIASGSVFESKGSDDAWSMYPHERRALLDFLKDEVGDGVI